MHFFFALVQALACIFIAWHSLQVLNKMTRQTAQLVRAAYVSLTGAGVAGLLSCFVTYVALNCLFAVGVALFLVANQRANRGRP